MRLERFYIIGLPGAGKTHLLKSFNGLKTLDLDTSIEESYLLKYQNALSIHEIFNQLHTHEFRSMERYALRRVFKDIQLVSCGGGTPCYFDNIDFMLKTGTVLWLETPVVKIVERVTSLDRPVPVLSKNDKPDNLKDRLEKLLKKRTPFYAKANHRMGESEMLNFLNNVVHS